MNNELIFDYILGSEDDYDDVDLAPLNGTYTDAERQPFSTLDTTLFLNAIMDGASAEDNGDSRAYVEAAYTLLQSIPVQPPRKSSGSGVMKLFKQSSGVFQIPHAYALWVGSLYHIQKDKQREKTLYDFKYSLFEGGKLVLDGFKHEDVPMARDMGYVGNKTSIHLNKEGIAPSSLRNSGSIPTVGYGLYNDLYTKHRYLMLGEYMNDSKSQSSRNIIKNAVSTDRLHVFSADIGSDTNVYELYGAFEVTKNSGYDLYNSVFNAMNLGSNEDIYIALKNHLESKMWSQQNSGTSISDIQLQFRVDVEDGVQNLSVLDNKVTFISFLIDLGLAPEGSDDYVTSLPEQAEVISQALTSVARKTFIDNTDLISTDFNILLYPCAAGVRRPLYYRTNNYRKLYQDDDGVYYYDSIAVVSANKGGYSARSSVIKDSSKAIKFLDNDLYEHPIEFDGEYSVTDIENRISSTANYLWYSGPALSENSTEHLKSVFTRRVLQSSSEMGLEISSGMTGNFGIAEFLSMFDEKTLEVFEREFIDFANPKLTTNVAGSFTFKSLIRSLMMLDAKDFQGFTYGDQAYTADSQIKLILGYSNNLFDYYNRKQNPNQPTYAKLMNMFLTAAQMRRARRTMSSFLSKSFLYRNSSIWDYHSVGDLTFNINRCLFNRGLLVDDLSSLTTEYIIREICFGPQQPDTTNTTSAQQRVLKKLIIDDDHLLLMDTKGTGFTDIDASIKDQVIDFFFEKMGLVLNETNVKMVLPFVRYYIFQYLTAPVKGFNLFDSIFNGNSNTYTYKRDIIELVERGRIGFSAYMSGFENTISDSRLADVEQELEDNLNLPFDLKSKLYYDIKAIYDNWVLFSSDETKWYNYYKSDDECSDKQSVEILRKPKSTVQRDVFDYFEFVDRGNNDVGSDTYFDMKWLSEFFGEDVRSTELSNWETSFYGFLSQIAGHHNFLLHTLPAFTNLGSLDTEEARNMFGTFGDVEITNSAPTVLFQYAGDITSKLSSSSTNGSNLGSSSFCLDVDNAEPPKDILNTSSGATCFVVDYGSTNQQIFKDLSLDQSEYQSTAEYFTTITDLARKGAQTTGNNLFKIYSQQMYTAKIGAMGNAMLMPMTYFYLKNVPLFNGTYWITNVSHSITPNNMQSSFQGIRQPISVLPKRRQTIMRLVNDKIKATVGDLEDVNSTNAESVSSAHADLTGSSVITNLQTSGVITQEHMLKVEEVVDYLNTKYGTVLLRDDLVAVIHNESGWNPKAVNSIGGATGLIQWLPSTAADVHTLTTTQIRNMTTLEQLDLVQDYLEFWIKNKKFKAKSIIDLYILIFYPYAFDQSESYVIGSQSNKTYRLETLKSGDLKISGKSIVIATNNPYFSKFRNKREITHPNYITLANKIFDLDGNGEITKKEFGTYMLETKVVNGLGGKIIYA